VRPFEFVKYQSLGNDCIIIDRYRSKKSAKLSSTLVVRLCDRHFGVGADGVILIERHFETQLPSIQIFNSDGSQAETCLNGLRCVADYLFETYDFPSTFQIQIGVRVATCTVCALSECSKNRRIRTEVGPVLYLGQKCVETSQGVFIGHAASIGNPHCIFFYKQTSDWLRSYGREFESHPLFPEKTNVEFVSSVPDQQHPTYNLLVYERGCGMTLACGSGAAAFVGVLITHGMISPEQMVFIQMQGGILTAYVNQLGSVVLEASASRVFKGNCYLNFAKGSIGKKFPV
jgi:diaminopimelate epimerase